MTDAPDWNTWFQRLRLGLWTDTPHYRNIAEGKPTRQLRNSDIAWLPFHGVHIFIAGETGYGKSNTERVILKELWPGIRDGAVEVVGFDAQLGVELQGAHDAGYLKEFHFGKETGVKTPEYPDGKPFELTFAEALERHVDIMRERTVWMRQHSIQEWKITKDDPARVILIDEAGQLFRPNIPPKITNRIIGAIDTLTYQSRKCGYVVVACTQHSNLKQIPIRHGLTFGVAHRMKTTLAYEQVTGNGMDMPHLQQRVKGLAYMSGHQKRILKTQFIPSLAPPREPVVVNAARMPRLEEDTHTVTQMDTMPALTGTIVENDSYESEYERYMAETREYR